MVLPMLTFHSGKRNKTHVVSTVDVKQKFPIYTSGNVCERIKQKWGDDNFTLNGKPWESSEQRSNRICFTFVKPCTGCWVKNKPA